LVAKNRAAHGNNAEILPAITKDGPENDHKQDTTDAHHDQDFGGYLFDRMHD
jgi:hypothetical protein